MIESRVSTEQAAAPPVAKTSARVGAADWDVSESFRRARTAISGVTKDFEALRRRARSLVKSAERPVK